MAGGRHTNLASLLVRHPRREREPSALGFTRLVEPGSTFSPPWQQHVRGRRLSPLGVKGMRPAVNYGVKRFFAHSVADASLGGVALVCGAEAFGDWRPSPEGRYILNLNLCNLSSSTPQLMTRTQYTTPTPR